MVWEIHAEDGVRKKPLQLFEMPDPHEGEMFSQCFMGVDSGPLNQRADLEDAWMNLTVTFCNLGFMR